LRNEELPVLHQTGNASSLSLQVPSIGLRFEKVDKRYGAVYALRNLTLKSTGIEGIYRDVLILAGFSIVMITCSIALFKRQI